MGAPLAQLATMNVVAALPVEPTLRPHQLRLLHRLPLHLQLHLHLRHHLRVAALVALWKHASRTAQAMTPPSLHSASMSAMRGAVSPAPAEMTVLTSKLA